MAMASAPTKRRLDGTEESRSAGAQFIRRPLRSEGTYRYGYCYGDRAFINRSYQYVASSGRVETRGYVYRSGWYME